MNLLIEFKYNNTLEIINNFILKIPLFCNIFFILIIF